ncbi:putative ubiquitin carboxyl-terminal hydrolase 50 [Channa argus]|uniref:ubiquitinyl hydrolase 1 n=1 Tax=Channa argus TaxID=215402 RepID=A0A6G1P8U7_CHAAH|nr:putative ubiquitin carboxyl-terminal hydrolase 50 [Channa argus]
MKAKALSVKECTWMSEECHLVDEPHGNTQRISLCLPNIFRSKKVKPFTRSIPAYQVYYTARELLLEVLDRGAVRELIRRPAGVKAGAARPSYSQSREQSTELSEEEYVEVLTWFSIVLQSGLSTGDNSSFGSELTLNLDGWQGVLKRNSFQTILLSLTRLNEGDKLDTLSAFCGHLTRRYQTLYTPGPNLAVKKYQLSYQQGPSSLYLALLCDISSGFICNMYLYCPEQLQKQSRKPVVEQVVTHLLRPFCSCTHLVQLDTSASMISNLAHIFSGFGVKICFAPTVEEPSTETTSSSPPAMPDQHQQTPEDSLSHPVAHLGGWTGPALFLSSEMKGLEDVFLPGLWVALHVICINTFVLHSRQSQGSGRHVHLTQFTRNLASQLTSDSSITVPVLPRLNSSSYQETRLSNRSKQRSKCRVAEVFVRLLQEMWLGRSSSCAPVEARSVLCSILPQFNNYSQQDAQELLLSLLNALHDDLKKDCLSLFFEHTILTGGEQMLCSVCGLRRETTVLTCLEKAPEILLLHLKRFGCKGKNQVKLRTNVLFSMKLDLNPFLSSSVQSTLYSSYCLYAVVNHIGHLNMGHYTALCHNTLTRTWHCFDDSTVREEQDNLVQSPNAYLLLYSRKPFQKPKISGL